MRAITFSRRVAKEILRDPLNLCFGLGFPLIVLVLLSAIQRNIPVKLFAIETLAPGVAVFGLSFITLFSALLISRDRETSFLRRLYTTPLSTVDFILGYTIPLLPISLAQSVICYLAALFLGLKPTVHLLTALLLILPISLFYIALGLLCGSLLNTKQAGGICGALLTNLAAWLSGVWFDVELVGGAFQAIANALPFLHAVNLERSAVSGGDFPVMDLLWVLCYTAVIFAAALLAFLHQRRRQ